ncbi:hypothetical protein O0I10_005341 [Lichtheimia ornata]|uniref:Uncharacterized protein n=1 Tax=Lichtheimia ornata TaxID=688661 RepID=A0AAD7V457_9FUNG|nr:uncharacterized protein O0I10_005341 [Lichtheimia ornata]KAJ8658959.1 hypothetical protein O0I10_005341 [Lichtheimia ornata]
MRITLPLVGVALSFSLVIAAPARIEDSEDALAIPKFETFSSDVREAMEEAAKQQQDPDDSTSTIEHSSHVYHNRIEPLNTLPSLPIILEKRDKKNQQADTLVGGLMQKGLVGFNPQPDPTEKSSSKKKKKGKKPSGLTGMLGGKIFGSGSSSLLKKQALRFKQPSTGKKKKGGSHDPPIMINPASNSGIISVEGQNLGPVKYGTTKKAPEP